MLKYIKELIMDANNKLSVGRLGYLMTIITTTIWINAIFAVYCFNSYMGKLTPDIPPQLVMVIITLLGGYLGTKGTEMFTAIETNAANVASKVRPLEAPDESDDKPS